MNRHQRYNQLIEACKLLKPIKTAVIHPCDHISLDGVVNASKMALIEPILIGPEKKIHAIAEQHDLDISLLTLINTPHSHAAAIAGVNVVNEGKAQALMKGSLHTDELMSAVVKHSGGLRTERRISHCFIIDVPNHKHTVIVTDAAINIAPSLEVKVDIVQNAIDMAIDLGIVHPKVAILSAMETVNTKVPSTIEAAALCKMADRKQITGGILDGPLAFDNAISLEAASIKNIDSPVAGNANILVVPNLESGNVLAKSLIIMAGADAAGIVLGAKVPIILTSRADAVLTRLASCAIAALIANARISRIEKHL
ncbi:MAG: phosphate acetyltransferase [Pseudomonadota bacterium]